MPRITYNKSALHKQREQLRLYERVLPSLDLKRMQLMAERQRARRSLDGIRSEAWRLLEETARELPMLANRDVELTRIVKVEAVVVGQENIVGVRVPVLREVLFTGVEYAMLARPPWVDDVVLRLKQMAELRAGEAVAADRVRLLERAERRITQRVNLFEKILIPTARKAIQKIRIALADAERSAVVRSKITKSMRRHQRQTLLEEGEEP